MALTLEELYARRAQQRQAQRGLLGSPMGARRGMTGMAGMGGSAMQSIPSMADSQVVVPDMGMVPDSLEPDTEGMLDGDITASPEVIDMMQASSSPAGGLLASAAQQQTANDSNLSTINSLYNQYLGRDGNPTYMQGWADQLAAGASPDQVAAAIAASPEGQAYAQSQQNAASNEQAGQNLSAATPQADGATVTIPPTDAADQAANDANLASVNSLYNQYLGRNGNPDNMQYWANQLADGASITDVANAIANSPEGQAFAAAQDVLVDNDPVGGDTDSGGQTDTTGTPATAAGVQGLYQRLLGRAGADSFIQGWLDSGASLEEIELAIRQSPEFLERGNNPPPENFDEDAARSGIIAAYQSLLGRAPLEDGLNYWLGTMRDGASLPQVLYNIRQSPEFGGRITGAVDSLFRQFVQRGATEEEKRSFLERAKGGMTLAQIEEEIRALGATTDTTTNPDTGVPQAADPTPTPTGSQTGTQDALDETQTYDAETAGSSGTAEAIGAETPDREVQPEETVQYQLAQILGSDSPLMQRARTQGLQFANRRGLLNSSIGAQAAQTAMLDQALPIAQQDARTFAEAAAQTTDIEGRAGLQDAALGTDVSKFNVAETGVTNRFNASSINEAGRFNADQANAAIQNFLQREAARLLQDDQQLFTAQQNAADRELRNFLQERQFDFQGSENALDRSLQVKLQENDQAFRSSESQLDRDFQSTERGLDRTFQAGESALDRDFRSSESALDRALTVSENAANRALEQMLQNDRIAFEEWSQTNSQEWNAAQNELQREFDRYRVDAQTASTVMYSAMESIAQIYADPNLTSIQKQNAIRNVMDSANSMPALVSQITAGMNRDTQNTLPDGVDATAYTDPEALLGDAYDPEANYWIGPFGAQYGQAHHPSWIIPPADGAQTEGIELITNPETGQIFIAPSGGYRLRGSDDDFTDPGGNSGSAGAPSGYAPYRNITTGEIVPGLYTGPNGGLFRLDPATNQMVPINLGIR